MSMIKLIMSDAFDSTVDVGMRLIEDPAQITKQASTIFGCDYSALKPDDDHVGVHLVALGATERYGLNRNKDGFSKAASQKYHDTFVKHAHIYRHHRNKDPRKSLGGVKASAYNDDMDRIELFVHAHKEKARDEIQRLEKEGEIPFSMACVLDPKYPVLTQYGYVPIEDIQVGDIVLTHKSNWKRVKALNRRTYTGRTYTFLVRGLPIPMELTADHLMWGKQIPEGLSRNTLHGKARHEDIPAGWVHAEHYKAGDRLIYGTPVRIPGFGAIDCPDLAKIMGYYLAEGSFGTDHGKVYSVHLACNLSDSLPREVPKIVERILPGVTCKIRPAGNSDLCLDVAVHNVEFAQLIYSFVGKGAKGKWICPEIFNAEPEIKLNFLGGWLDGDGFIDSKGIHWSTSSQNLALQGRDLLATLGVSASIYKIDHAKCETSGMDNSGVEYTLNIAPTVSDLLTPYSDKASKVRAYMGDDYPETSYAALRRNQDGTFTYRIREVSSREVVDTPTYNLEVEDDESYTLAGLMSHNCRVPGDYCTYCGQFRRNADDPNQCEHIAEKLGELMDDGRVVGMDNRDPDFFDISFVGRPADRIAWNLKVASGEIVTSIKLAEASGIWVPDSLAIESPSALRKLELMRKIASYETMYRQLASSVPRTPGERYIWELRKSAAARIDDDTISTLRCCEPADLFSTLADAGVVMDAPSFFKYAFGVKLEGVKDIVPDAIKAAAGIFSQLDDAGDCQSVCNDSTFDVTGRRISVKMPGDAIMKTASAYGFVGPVRDERILLATIDSTNIKIAVDKSQEKDSNYNYKAMVLATKYAAYKLSAVEAIVEKHRDTDVDSVCASVAAQNLVSVEE